jgi:hypothetical protein
MRTFYSLNAKPCLSRRVGPSAQQNSDSSITQYHRQSHTEQSAHQTSKKCFRLPQRALTLAS